MAKALRILHGEIRTPPLSVEARREIGFLLRQLQEGLSLSLPASRPMLGIEKGCHELKVRDERHDWRIVYGVEPDAIVILEIFEKASRNAEERHGRLPKAHPRIPPTSPGGDMSENKEARKAARLEKVGWRTTTVQEFLGLSDEDMAIIEVKVALAKRLRAQRTRAGFSQVEVAKIVRSSQPRVAKMEAADKTVSIDLLVKALVKTGVSVQEIGRSLEKVAPARDKASRAQRLAHS